MQNLLHETRITLTALARREKVAIPTTWRWRQRGLHGIKLESFLVGNRRYTTEEAFARWVAATTAAADGEAPKARTSRQREAAVSAAERELAQAGI